jgi:hypothetical protein
MNKRDIAKQESDFVLYTSNDGDVNLEVVLNDETVWLTQKAIAGLFGVKVPAISKHLANIYETGELRKESTISIFETVQKEGDRKVRRNLEFYNLDTIISVGYRVNSYQTTQFRIWATKTLKEYIIKGFVQDDERLKQEGLVFGKAYLDRISINSNQICTLEKLRDTLLPKLMGGEVRIQFGQEATVWVF